MDQLLELLDDLGHVEPADPDTITAAALAVRAEATTRDRRPTETLTTAPQEPARWLV